jgi:hypothetical protein
VSLAAGLTYLGFIFTPLALFLSVPSLLLMFAIIVLFGAILVRLGANIIGGFIVGSFAFLWWYFAMSGPYITLEGLMTNLRSPVGIMTSAAMLLGIGAGAVDVAEAILFG